MRSNDNRAEVVRPQPDIMPYFALDYFERSAGSYGSDGDRLLSIPRWIPFLILTGDRATERYAASRASISSTLWPEIHERYASGESLRSLAQYYGVSHEAVRSIVPVQDAA